MALVNLKSEKIYFNFFSSTRMSFLSAAVLMLVSLPFMHNFIPFTEEISIIFILLISIISGINNLHNAWISVFDIIFSAVCFVFFSFYTVQLFIKHDINLFFWINNLLGIIFFFATYFSTSSFFESIKIR